MLAEGKMRVGLVTASSCKTKLRSGKVRFKMLSGHISVRKQVL